MNGNNLDLIKKQPKEKKDQPNWKEAMELTKQHQTIIEVVKRLADK